MNKKILIGIIYLLCVGTVFALANYKDMEYYVRDKVSGKNLQLLDFRDDLGIIDSLVYNEQIKKNTNTFSADIGYGITNNGEDSTYELENFKFNGIVTFDDKSNVKYELTDFEVIDIYVDEYGVTSAYGEGVLVYTATIKIEKKIPVEAAFDFYQDVDDKTSFANNIWIRGIDHNELIGMELEDEGTQTFKHNRECYVGCEK